MNTNADLAGCLIKQPMVTRLSFCLYTAVVGNNVQNVGTYLQTDSAEKMWPRRIRAGGATWFPGDDKQPLRNDKVQFNTCMSFLISIDLLPSWYLFSHPLDRDELSEEGDVPPADRWGWRWAATSSLGERLMCDHNAVNFNQLVTFSLTCFSPSGSMMRGEPR